MSSFEDILVKQNEEIMSYWIPLCLINLFFDNTVVSHWGANKGS